MTAPIAGVRKTCAICKTRFVASGKGMRKKITCSRICSEQRWDERKARWKRLHPEYYREKNRLWRERHPDKWKESILAWRKRNAEHVREYHNSYQARWLRENPERYESYKAAQVRRVWRKNYGEHWEAFYRLHQYNAAMLAELKEGRRK